MNIICIGAHPDDAEFYAGGTSILWAGKGHRVMLVSATNGDIGHHAMAGGPLAQRRAAEAAASAAIAGCHSKVLGWHDGELMPTLDARKEIVRLIREWNADIVLTHRPNDYHPDHRYCSMLVQDAAFMVTVPNFCPETPRLEHNPVFLYTMDRFERPAPFRPDIAVDVTPVMNTKFAMLDAMASQVYEWLPWLRGNASEVPDNPDARRAWLETAWGPYFRSMVDADGRRDALARWYGAEDAARVEYAEFFEICEYGRQPDPHEISALFPFLRPPEAGLA